MKLRIFAIVAALSAGSTFSHANITNVTLEAYSDAVMTCSNTDVTYIGPGLHDFQVGINGEQYSLNAAVLNGYVSTDQPGDPNLNLVHAIDNDTVTPWTDYHVQVSMNQLFTFSDITVTNTGWTVGMVGGPAFNGTDWVGTIDFLSGGLGTLINPNDILGFSFTIGFNGPVAFTETLTPSFSVPEPNTVAVLACGLMGLLVLQRRLAA